MCLCLFPYFSYPQTRDASGIWQKIASPTKRSAQSFCQIGTLLWKKRCLKMITWLVHAEHGRQWVLLLWPPEAVELIRAGVHIDISFFLLSALSARKHPKLVPCLRFMGCRQVSLSLHWTGVWSVFLHHFGEDSCIMVFPEHRIPGVSFTQAAKTRLRLFSASKDALRIWSVKSATVSRKSQWRYFEALLHLSLGLGFSTISGWYFLWWRCIFKANIS